MTTNTATRSAAADASVLASVRGWPSWMVIVLALATTIAGTAVDGLTTGVLAWGLRIGFYLGVILAALLVRRGSIFTAMVQPPLILAVSFVIGEKLFTDEGGYAMLIHLVNTFPTMAIGTAAAVVIGLIRILAQPLRSRSAGAPLPHQ